MAGLKPATLQRPSFEKFEKLKYSLFGVLEHPLTRVRGTHDGHKLFFYTERSLIDIGGLPGEPLPVGFNYIAVLSGIMKTCRSQNKLLLRYREIPQTEHFQNSGFVHDYILRTESGEVVEYGQSIRAIPGGLEELEVESSDIASSLIKRMQDDEARRILRANLGNQLDLYEGDCDLLSDRMHEHFI